MCLSQAVLPCELGSWPMSGFSSSQLCFVRHAQTAVVGWVTAPMLTVQPALLQPALA